MSNARLEVRKELIKSNSIDLNRIDNNDFYFETIEDGLFCHMMSINHTMMFDKGSGSELVDKNNEKAKARAIDSSSMLSYNFFSGVSEKSPLTIDGIEYVSVYFEVRLKTLVTSNAPANLDVALVDKSRKNVLFLESKFLEYTENEEAKISDSYKTENKYYKENKEITNLIKLADRYQGKKGEYWGGVKQNFCHMVAISNLDNELARQYAKRYNVDEMADIFDSRVNYKFCNILYVPSPSLAEAHARYERYCELLDNFYQNMGNLQRYLTSKGIAMSYTELYSILAQESSHADRLSYLRSRYMFCSDLLK